MQWSISNCGTGKKKLQLHSEQGPERSVARKADSSTAADN